MSHLSMKIGKTISSGAVHSVAKQIYYWNWNKSLQVWRRGYFLEIIGRYLEELLDGIRRMSPPTQVGGVTKVDR